MVFLATFGSLDTPEGNNSLTRVATGSYNGLMEHLKTVGIKDLKNNLSAYLREVRRGAKIYVCDRNIIVAELREPLSGGALMQVSDPVWAEWVSQGVVTPPSAAKQKLSPSPVRARKGLALALIDEDRAEGAK